MQMIGVAVTFLAVLFISEARAQTSPAPLAGLPPEAVASFAAGRRQFEAVETPASGLGPVFNAASCAACHKDPASGGSSATFVTRFGRTGPDGFDTMPEDGGPVLQRHGITTSWCSVPAESVPPGATVVTRRDTPALFGAGLIDAIPDREILRHADPGDRDHD